MTFEATKSASISRSLWVEKVREHMRVTMNGHIQSLDYFRFGVPELRNAFAHGNAIVVDREAALGVLYDLAYLCDVIRNLKTPVTELTRLLEEDAPTDALRWLYDALLAYEKVKEDGSEVPELLKRLEDHVQLTNQSAANLAERFKEAIAKCEKIDSWEDWYRLEPDPLYWESILRRLVRANSGNSSVAIISHTLRENKRQLEILRRQYSPPGN